MLITVIPELAICNKMKLKLEFVQVPIYKGIKNFVAWFGVSDLRDDIMRPVDDSNSSGGSSSSISICSGNIKSKSFNNRRSSSRTAKLV